MVRLAPPITLRDARPGDTDALDGAVAPQRVPGDHPTAIHDVRFARDEGLVRVAVSEDGRVVGAQHYRPLDSTQGWLSRLRVDPAFRHHGIAGMLVADAIQMARNEHLLTVRYAGDATNEAIRHLSQVHHARPRGSWVSFERTVDAAACEVGRSKPSLGQEASALSGEDRQRALSLVHASGSSLFVDSWTWRALDASAITSLIRDEHAFLARSGVGGWSLALLAAPLEATMEATLFGTDSVCTQAVLDHLKRLACASVDGVDILVHVPQDSPAAGLLGNLARRGDWRPVMEHALRVWEIDLAQETPEPPSA